MRNALIILCLAVALCLAFFAGQFTAKRPVATTDNQNDAENLPDEPDENPAESEKYIFFSPKTGNDETGDGSQWRPFETMKKAEEISVGDGEKAVYLEFLMSVDVRTQAAAGVFSSAGGINMIPFTGSSDGAYFKGEIVGTGCDTQKYGPDGSVLFSARYILKGKDYTGQQCSIFIENNGHALDKCTPTIITDSAALSEWQNYSLRAIVTPVGTGVIVDVYRIYD